MDRLSYCIFSVVFSFMDNLSLTLFKLTNKEHYALLENNEELSSYEVNILDFIKNNIKLNSFPFYYHRLLRPFYNDENYNTKCLLLYTSVDYNNTDALLWILERENLNKWYFEDALAYAIKTEATSSLTFLLGMLDKVHKLIYEREYHSDDEYFNFDNDYYDLISSNTITQKLLDACIDTEPKKSIKILKENKCIYKWTFLRNIIKKNKKDFLFWFVKNICKKINKQDIFTLYDEAINERNSDMLKMLRFKLGLEVSIDRIEYFIKSAEVRDSMDEVLIVLNEIKNSIE